MYIDPFTGIVMPGIAPPNLPESGDWHYVPGVGVVHDPPKVPKPPKPDLPGQTGEDSGGSGGSKPTPDPTPDPGGDESKIRITEKAGGASQISIFGSFKYLL